MKDKTFDAIAAELLNVSYVCRLAQDWAVRIILAISLFVACFLLASPAEAVPVIQLMTPQSGPVGTLVAIVGSGFGTSQGTSTVTFNGKPVTWVSWSATSLQVQVPAGATSGNVVVTVSGKASNAKSFTVTPPPVITGLSLTSGPVGATIAITGSNFTAGGTQSPQVVFNPQIFASPISSTDTSITVSVPAGAATGDLLVSVGGGNSNSALFTVSSSNPSISSLTPAGGVVGTGVTISGTNFGSSQGASTVTFNGTTGTPTSWSATSINVPVPTGTTTGNVLVTVGGVASNPYGFEVGTAAPKITSISPTSGAVPTSVTINGTNFGSTQGANTVNFNGVSGVPTSWTATQIKVPVPTGATTGNVVVTASGTVSNGVSFTVPGTGPSVTSLSPASGPVGTSVTIAGTNFNPTQGASTVTFNGIAATATGWSPTSIVATVPSGATTGNVVVTVGGTASSGSNFIVAPSITGLSPTSGAVGTTVTIAGTSFGLSQGTSTVTFNGTAAIPTSWGTTSITVPVPSAATTGNVVVKVGGVASNGVNFTVVSTPTITSLNPASGGAGASVTITGTNFGATQGSSTITFNGMAGTPTTWSATSIVVPVPSGATTGDVVVTVGGVASGGSTFTVATLTSLSLTPAKASISAGSSLQFILAGIYSDGSNRNVGSTANWGSSTPSVATISSTGLAMAASVGQTTIQASVGSLNASATLGIVRQTLTGSLPTALGGNTLTVLEDTTVLVAGGDDSNGQNLNSATIYNFANGSFVSTGNLNVARSIHTATLLNNGLVLVVGGTGSAGALASAELYDPSAGTFTPTGSLGTARSGHTATLLPSGMVLVTGGADNNGNPLGTSELYDPAAGTFRLTGNLTTARLAHTAMLLNSGMVLIAGGADSSGNVLQSAELYNPVTAVFASTGSMVFPRASFTATLLNGGFVLMTGGVDSTHNSQASAELYNPTAGTFAAVGNLNSPRSFFTTTLLNNGTVLAAGGLDASGNVLGSAELYDPLTASFSPTSGFVTPRYTDTAVLLNNGNVLAVGGLDSNFDRLASAELYQPSTVTPAGLVSIAVSPLSPTVANGGFQPFLATGTFSDSSTQTLASVTWNSSSAGIATVTDDESNNGIAYAVGPGSATITACTGSVCGSAGMTVTLPAPLPPSITSLSPSSGAVGSLVTISGTNFGATQGASTISFNGIVAAPTVWSATSIVVPVPSGATSGPLSITVNGSPASVNFQVLGPYLASLSPSFAGIGSTVTVIGSGFGATQGTGLIIVGGKQPFVVSWSDTQIVVAIIPGTTSGQAQVSQGGFTSNSLNFTVAAPSLASVSPTSGTAGTQVTFSGSGFGTSQGNGNVLLGTNYGSIVSWSDTQIVATVTAGSAIGTAQVLQGGAATTSIPFTISAPTIASVSPATGSVGTQVIFTGSGFGASQGIGKVLLGTNFGSVVNWSDTQVVATVASGSISGTAQIVEGALRSNSLNFTVITPTITSVTPTSGEAGTQVTIFGSGFGAVQGNGNAWIGSSYASVMSWNDTQVVATVASVSASGYAQILQNGVWSNSVPFTSNAPYIASVTPASGSPGTAITIAGSGFGPSTGVLQLGSLQGSVSSWTDSQIVANVASGSVTGIVQVQQNGLTSNSLRFVVPTSGPGNNVILVPSLLNPLVQHTHAIQALTPGGAVVTGLTWTSSDPTVVSLSTDDPPVLTAVAPGHATITAGDSSCEVTVNAGSQLPISTAVWTVPGDGSGVVNAIPAVPSESGVDVFAVQNSGKVQAITIDGLVAWTADVGTDYTSLNADFQGGLVATTASTITKYDGITGHQTSQYTYANPGNSPVYFGTDGTIFTIDGDSVVGVDPATGTAKFKVRMQHGGDSYLYTCESQSAGGGDEPPGVQASTLAGDGYLYVFYEYMSSYHADAPLCGGSSGGQSTVQRVLRVGPAGDHAEFPIGSHSSGGMTYYFPKVDASNNGGFISIDSESGVAVHITSISTNADQGIFASWVSDATNAYCSSYTFFFAPFGYMDFCAGSVQSIPSQSGVMTVSSAGVSRSPTGGSYAPSVQAADGTFYGGTDQASLSAFDASGNVKWSVPNSTSVLATIDNGLIGKTSSGQYITLDPNGSATGQVPSALLNAASSWLPMISYAIGGDGTLTSQATPLIQYAGSYAAMSGGNQSGNGTPIQQVMTQQQQGSLEQLPSCSAKLHSNYNSIELQTSMSLDDIFSKYILTYDGVRAINGNDVADTIIGDTSSPSPAVTASGQTITFTLNSFLTYLYFPTDPNPYIPNLQQHQQVRGPFSVQVQRFDSEAHTISAVTLQGHPLAGWRYWRVFSNGTNDVVIETGAVDTYGPFPLDFLGYFLFQGKQLKLWNEYLNYIKTQIGAPQGTTPAFNVVNGEWDTIPTQSYIMNNVGHPAICQQK